MRAKLYKRLIIKHSNNLTREARNVALNELLPRTLQALALISSIAKPKPKETRNRHSICICSSRVKIHSSFGEESGTVKKAMHVLLFDSSFSFLGTFPEEIPFIVLLLIQAHSYLVKDFFFTVKFWKYLKCSDIRK